MALILKIPTMMDLDSRKNRFIKNNLLTVRITVESPGPDGIHNEFIKNCGTKLVHWSNEFLNICYRHIRIPKQWRHANVISILKPGKPETSP